MALTKLMKKSNGEKLPDVFGGVSNIFDDFLRNEFLTRETGFIPGVNISEDKKNYFVEISAPGYLKDDIKVEMSNHMLTISAEKKEEQEKQEKSFFRKEFSYGSFTRSFSLPETVKEDKIKAKYDNGILRLTLPKKEETKSKSKAISIE